MQVLYLTFASALAVSILLNYAPLYATMWRWKFSPRLWLVKFLPPIDIFVTLYLIGGSWFGIGNANAGIGMVTFAVSSAVGLSLAVLVIRKFFLRKWEKQYNTAVINALI